LVSPDTIDALIAFLEQAVKESGVRYVHISFHGGEPLLLKKANFAAMCEKLASRLGSMCEFSLSLQTNGVLIDADWIDLFERFQISVGVSFDGNEESHNKTRINKKGVGTYSETRAGWELLRQAASTRKIPVLGILCVIDPEQSGAATFDHFADDLRAPLMNFLLPDLTHDSISATERFVQRCGDYMIAVCQAWFQRADPNVQVRFIRSITEPLLANEVSEPEVPLRQEVATMLTISSNGEISLDDKYRPLAWRFRDTGFRVQDTTIDAFRSSELSKELVGAQTRLPQGCRGCVWRGICQGGQTNHRFSMRRGFDNPSVYCKALSRTYAFVCKTLVEAGISSAALEQRLALLAGYVDDLTKRYDGQDLRIGIERHNVMQAK
jgi:uncharacterized protein